MAQYVTLVNTAGQAVAVNPEQACALIALGPALTRIMLNTGAGETSDTVAPYIDVPQALAAVVVALQTAGGPAAVLAFGVVDGATGNLLAGVGSGLAGAVRNAVGDYTVTLQAAPPLNAFALVSSADGGDGVVTTNGPLAGLNMNVRTFDTAGLAADRTFTIAFLGTL